MPRLTRALALLAAVSAALVAARPGWAVDVVVVPLRVHLISSSVRDLNGANAVSTVEVRERLDLINQAFRPAGVRFELDAVQTETVGHPAAWSAAVRGDGPRRDAYQSLVDPTRMIAPRGLDLYVVRTLADMELGGLYSCNVDGTGRGAAFIAVETDDGTAQPTRKWAHELGHALGLRHTPCDATHADNLMMSGRCEHADRGRVALDAVQREQVRRQALAGGPMPCRRNLPELQ